MDKFAKYCSTEEKISEISEYVHLNFKLIMTKMTSEMRRKLDITPDMKNPDGYVSLILSLQGRLFNEMVYSMAAVLQTTNMRLIEVLPPATLIMILEMMQGVNPLHGSERKDVKDDQDGFLKYYAMHIDEIRKCIEALPK